LSPLVFDQPRQMPQAANPTYESIEAAPEVKAGPGSGALEQRRRWSSGLARRTVDYGRLE
jgi:hypothetical protein